ncbi:MAG: hypothetical protein L0K50_00900, partial [Lacticaseibacillus paracasei]|nr:hypothetical protein [Lacticaseibacillus paracasei]
MALTSLSRSDLFRRNKKRTIFPKILGRLFAFICQSRIIGKPVLLRNAKKRLFQIGVNKVETVARAR